MGTISLTQCRIYPTRGAKQVYQQAERAGHKARDVKIDDVNRMLREGVIEPATSEGASEVVLVEKKTNLLLMFCIDYKKLEAVTVRD